jgi:hypothetical protein
LLGCHVAGGLGGKQGAAFLIVEEVDRALATEADGDALLGHQMPGCLVLRLLGLDLAA